jgi:hypothetical protein
MAGHPEVSTKLNEALDSATKCFEAERSEGYEALREELDELESLAAEACQAQTAYQSLAGKLENGTVLTAEELNTLKLLIIGDADYYLKYNDDYDRSKSEAKRIIDEIRGLRSSPLDVDALMHLRVLCREAVSVLIPTGYYLEQKERVSKFQEATRGSIDRGSGKMLADIIRREVSR